MSSTRPGFKTYPANIRLLKCKCEIWERLHGMINKTWGPNVEQSWTWHGINVELKPDQEPHWGDFGSFSGIPKKILCSLTLNKSMRKKYIPDILQIRANTKPLQTFYIWQILLGAKAQLQNLTSSRSYIDHNFYNIPWQPVDQNRGGGKIPSFILRRNEKWEESAIRCLWRKLLEEVQNIVGWLLPHGWHWHS